MGNAVMTPAKTPGQVAGRAAGGATIAGILSKVLGGITAHFVADTAFDAELQANIVMLVEVASITGLVGLAVWAREKGIPVLSLIGLVGLVVTLGACAKPATTKYAIAVESYTATVESSTPLVEEFVGEGEVSTADLSLIQGTFNAARTSRDATVAVVRECEAWSAANDGDPDCPQATKIRAAAKNIDEAAIAIQRVVEAAITRAKE